jgi:hypothetical protein
VSRRPAAQCVIEGAPRRSTLTPRARRPAPEASVTASIDAFDVGQFQHGDTGLGIFYPVSELLLASGIGVSYAYAARFASTAPAQSQVDALNARLATAAMVNRPMFASLAAMTLGSIKARRLRRPHTDHERGQAQ